MPAPAWARWCPTPTASRLGRSSCGPTRASAGRKTSRTCRSRSACAREATSTCRIGWGNICRSNTSRWGTRAVSGRGPKHVPTGGLEGGGWWRAQIGMAEQLGLRQIIADTFKTLWWVPDDFEPDVVRAYLRALERAEKAMDEDMEKYLPLWKLAVPAEFENFHPWDY